MQGGDVVRHRRAQREGRRVGPVGASTAATTTPTRDLYQTYNNGVPPQVTVLNTPLDVQENLDANFGVYAQDSWSMDR